MRDLKWWQWVLIAFVAISVLGAITGDPKTRKGASDQISSGSAEPRPLAPAKVRLIAGKSTFAVTIDPRMAPAALPSFARDRCDGMAQCTVFVWSDAALAARGFPLTDRELSGLAFQYNLNRLTGLEKSLWDCRRYRNVAADACIKS